MPVVIPPLVSAYLERALPAGRPVPRHVRITVAFAWRARFPIMAALAINVVDAYAAGEGRLDVRLLGRTLQREHGPELSAGEAMRYLAELPWVPYAMAHNSELPWRELDGGLVEVTTRVGSRTVAVALQFDERGDVARASAARPFRRGETWTPTPWSGEFSDYQELGGMRMPTRAEVYWELPEGRYVYWRGRVVSALASAAPFEPEH